MLHVFLQMIYKSKASYRVVHIVLVIKIEIEPVDQLVPCTVHYLIGIRCQGPLSANMEDL